MAALIERFGLDTLRARRWSETLDYAERRTRARIAELDDGEREAADVLEAAHDEDIELQAARRPWRATSSSSTSAARPTSTTATSTARSP